MNHLNLCTRMKIKVLLIGLILATVSAYANSRSCNDFYLFEKKELSLDDNYNVEANRSSVENKNIFELFGDVSVVSPDYALSGDHIKLNRANKESTSIGNVRFNDNDLLLSTEKLILTKKNNINYFESAEATYSIPKEKIRGSASKISGNKETKDLYDANYSRCPIGVSDWSIRAKRITLNSKKNQGYAKHATLNFFGLPVIYSPSISWYLSGKGTGFLAPSYKSYTDSESPKKGRSVNLPYFINFASDKDLLLNLNHLSSRGNEISGLYRQLLYNPLFSKDGRIESELGFLENDKITKDQRWYFKNDLNLNFNSTDINLNTYRVSDKNYLKEIKLEGDSTKRLISSLSINNRNSFANVGFYLENEQLINNGSSDYTKAPELNISKAIGLKNNLDLSLSSSLTNFQNKNNSAVDGNRHHLNLKLQKEYSDLAYEFTPSLSIFRTDYKLNNNSENNISRNLYGVQLSSKVFLEREFEAMNKNFLQTLIPSVTYSYVPKKNQASIPNFDTASVTESFSSLFNLNNFFGFDKVTNQNNIAFGLESEFLDDDTGESYITLKTGQKFFLDDELMNSSGNFVRTNEADRGYSDILSSVEIGNNYLSFLNLFNYDPQTNNFGNSRSTIKLSFDEKNFIDLSYLDDNSTQSGRISGSFQLNSIDHLFLNVNRNFTTNVNDRLTFGIARENCCLAYRFGFFKKYLSSNTYSYDREFELVFKGLSTTTTSLRRRIESEVPGYIGDLNEL